MKNLGRCKMFKHIFMFCCMTQGIQGKYSSLSHVVAAESFVSVNEASTRGLLVINYCLKSFNVYDPGACIIKHDGFVIYREITD
jgi:hypothetical protein